MREEEAWEGAGAGLGVGGLKLKQFGEILFVQAPTKL